MKARRAIFAVIFASLEVVRAILDPALCPGSHGQTYTSSCGAKWIIECDTDHSGGDLPVTAQYVASLQQCIEICQSNSDCIDVSWILGSPKGACYLKEGVGPSRSDKGIWTGRRISGCAAALPVAPMSTTPTTAPPVVPPTQQAPANKPPAVVANNDPVVNSKSVVNNNPMVNDDLQVTGTKQVNYSPAVIRTNANVQQATPVEAGLSRNGDASNEGTTLSTMIVPNSAPTAWLSSFPGAGPVVTTMVGGSVLTVPIVGQTASNGLPTASKSAEAQNSSLTDGSKRATGTLGINTNLYGNVPKSANIRLSTGAGIGIGVGMGSFAFLFLAALFWLRWYKRRREREAKRSSTAHIDINNGHGSPGYRGEAAASRNTQELDDSSLTRPAEMESPTSVSGSFRSPVSPFSPGSGSSNVSPSNTKIYELIGSGPAELPGSPNPHAVSPYSTLRVQDSPTLGRGAARHTLEQVEEEKKSQQPSVWKALVVNQSLGSRWRMPKDTT